MRRFVIWADYIDRRYKIGATDKRYKIPFGVYTITVVDYCDLKVMLNYIRKKLAGGWTPEMCREVCEVD